MRSFRLSAIPTGLVLAMGLFLSGCANTPSDPTVGWSPEKIYTEARDQANSGAWDKAISFYEKLEGRAAGTVLAQQAQIDKAFAQYKTGDKAQAIATLDRFIRLHPGTCEVIRITLEAEPDPRTHRRGAQQLFKRRMFVLNGRPNS